MSAWNPGPMPTRPRSGPGRRTAAAIALSLAAMGLATAGQTAAVSAQPATEAAAESELPSGNTAYRTLADYEVDMAGLVAAHPRLVKPLTLPYETTSGRAVHGIEISKNVHADDGKPVFVTVGMHHGDEFPSGELTMEYAINVVENADEKPYSRLLRKARLVVVPVVNVDGFVRARRQTDTNTDMNRNYGFGWLPIPTGGAEPWSEPETRNMEWLLSTRQATTFVTQHTCIQVVLYPPLQLEVGPAQDVERFEELGWAMAEQYGPSYRALDSAHDYETTGEAIDWAYFATRGLAFTNETCPDAGVERTYETQVLDAYAGHEGAMDRAFEHTADPAEHARIVGKAPKGAVLRVTKSFEMYTHPHEQPDGNVRPTAFSTTLTSDLRIDQPDGKFTWAVNPSYRPIPPYQATGVEPHQTGFYTEPWILTCERLDGTVLQETPVNVDLGETVTVDLQECKREFAPVG